MIVSLALPMLAAILAAPVEPAVVGDPTVWTYLRAVLATFFMAGGLLFILAGSLGVLRLPDFYTRIHAAGMTDTAGAEAILFGLIIQAGWSQTSLKLAMLAFFLLLTSPTATHAIAHAAKAAGLKPLLGPWRAPRPGDPAPTTTEVTEGGAVTGVAIPVRRKASSEDGTP